jgi:predicted ATPase/DNA-binding CsgD family transcriptional regulator
MPASKRKSIFGNLPTPLSSFIGRQSEIHEIRQMLLSDRLVTLTGPGGCGKTRLALKVAQELIGEFNHGVWFVELASVADPALVPQTIAAALNVREQSGRTLIDILVDYLSSRRLLLILDNCEHLIAACAQIADTLLQKCPHLKILATSREALGITGEVAWTVPPLSLPRKRPWTNPSSTQDALSLYEESESVQLFVVRATAISPDFRLTFENGAWVAEICRHLDGMPLAIELAAARARSLSVQQIAQRLDDRFHLLTSGSRTAPPRHQTLASTLNWSYALLSGKEQKVLRRLSVFAGGATLEAAEAVCAGEGLESSEVLNTLSHLVDKSLVMVIRPEGGETRYRLLETIRQYALEKLEESGALEESKDRHLEYFIRWAESADIHLGGAGQLPWLESFEEEHDNLRGALEWCRKDEKRAAAGLRLALACARFWRSRGYLSEGRAQISTFLARVNEQLTAEVHARSLFWIAALAYLQSDYPVTRSLGEKSLALWRELNPANKSRLADTLDLLGELATEEGDYATAPSLFEEALAIYRELRDRRGTGDMLMQLGWAYMRMGEYEKVAPRMEEALLLFKEIGSPSLTAFALAGLGELAVRQGQYPHAVKMLQESLAIRRKHGHRWGIGASLGSLGWIALRQHDYKKLREVLGESLDIRTEINDKGGIAWCLEKLAEAKYEQGNLEDSTKIYAHAEALRAPIGSVIDPADQPEYARIISGLRSALGEDAFAALWADGAAMQLEDVIECALSESTTESTRAEKEKFGGLTAREREVASLIAQGKSNREIAEAMTVGVKTVETYVTRILNKLGFDSRVQIATWAVEKGLMKPGG